LFEDGRCNINTIVKKICRGPMGHQGEAGLEGEEGPSGSVR
jgi:hypothetical protein